MQEVTSHAENMDFVKAAISKIARKQPNEGGVRGLDDGKSDVNDRSTHHIDKKLRMEEPSDPAAELAATSEVRESVKPVERFVAVTKLPDGCTCAYDVRASFTSSCIEAVPRRIYSELADAMRETAMEHSSLVVPATAANFETFTAEDLAEAMLHPDVIRLICTKLSKKLHI